MPRDTERMRYHLQETVELLRTVLSRMELPRTSTPVASGRRFAGMRQNERLRMQA
jgi:hypothetical protein